MDKVELKLKTFAKSTLVDSEFANQSVDVNKYPAAFGYALVHRVDIFAEEKDIIEVRHPDGFWHYLLDSLVPEFLKKELPIRYKYYRLEAAVLYPSIKKPDNDWGRYLNVDTSTYRSNDE